MVAMSFAASADVSARWDAAFPDDTQDVTLNTGDTLVADVSALGGAAVLRRVPLPDWNVSDAWNLVGAKQDGHEATLPEILENGTLLLVDDNYQRRAAHLTAQSFTVNDTWGASIVLTAEQDGQTQGGVFFGLQGAGPSAIAEANAIYGIPLDEAYGFNTGNFRGNNDEGFYVRQGSSEKIYLGNESAVGISLNSPITIDVMYADRTLFYRLRQGTKSYAFTVDVTGLFARHERVWLSLSSNTSYIHMRQKISDFHGWIGAEGPAAGFSLAAGAWETFADTIKERDENGDVVWLVSPVNDGQYKAYIQNTTPIPAGQPFSLAFDIEVKGSADTWAQYVQVMFQTNLLPSVIWKSQGNANQPDISEGACGFKYGIYGGDFYWMQNTASVHAFATIGGTTEGKDVLSQFVSQKRARTYSFLFEHDGEGTLTMRVRDNALGAVYQAERYFEALTQTETPFYVSFAGGTQNYNFTSALQFGLRNVALYGTVSDGQARVLDPSDAFNPADWKLLGTAAFTDDQRGIRLQGEENKVWYQSHAQYLHPLRAGAPASVEFDWDIGQSTYYQQHLCVMFQRRIEQTKAEWTAAGNGSVPPTHGAFGFRYNYYFGGFLWGVDADFTDFATIAGTASGNMDKLTQFGNPQSAGMRHIRLDYDGATTLTLTFTHNGQSYTASHSFEDMLGADNVPHPGEPLYLSFVGCNRNYGDAATPTVLRNVSVTTAALPPPGRPVATPTAVTYPACVTAAGEASLWLAGEGQCAAGTVTFEDVALDSDGALTVAGDPVRFYETVLGSVTVTGESALAATIPVRADALTFAGDTLGFLTVTGKVGFPETVTVKIPRRLVPSGTTAIADLTAVEAAPGAFSLIGDNMADCALLFEDGILKIKRSSGTLLLIR